MNDIELITFGVFIVFFVAIIKAIIQTFSEKWSKKEWVELTEDDRMLIKHDANFNQFMTADEYAEKVQKLTEEKLRSKNI